MNIITKNFKYAPNKNVYGLTKELCSIYISNYFNKNKKNVVVLTSTLFEANNFYKSIQTYISDALFFPMDDFLTSVAIAVSPDLKIKRLETLEILKNDSNPHIVITSLMGFLKFLPDITLESEIVLTPTPPIISREIILEKLEEFGYKRESLVTVTGEYAVRGFIIDIFPIDYPHPIRIEFFGDEIDKIKEFDEDTQLTTDDVQEVKIKRFNESTSDSTSSLLDYMKDSSLFLIDETQILSSNEQLQKEIFDYNTAKELPTDTKYMYSLEKLVPAEIYKLDTINKYETNNSLVYTSKELENFNSNLDALKKFVEKKMEDYTIIFSLSTTNQSHIIENLFDEIYITDLDKVVKNKINITNIKINKGFIFEKNIVITPSDIDKTLKSEIKYKNTIKIGRKIKSYNELKDGDYIVHEAHGIGIYRGLKTLKNGEFIKDYIELEYQDKDKVYVPIDNIDKIYKYSSGDERHPKLNKLNNGFWTKKKNETRSRIRDISGELIELYANRNKIEGTPYKDYDDEIKFAFDFPFTLTADQEKTIREIGEDLKSRVPMDRLLCGDVGYGKTEVAFRAMFKTVINNFQVSYLCPTTILSKQQYVSAIERFKDFPVRIELLNRHVPAKKVTEILKDLEEGKIDIIIGTHKLLNDKIKYKRLGLLVIDEEQRFGVSHKEKIKKLKTDINVLTLSATPIPRTLKMAMSGLRSLSILDTPPINRYPIQTYVIEENELIMRDAIYKEMAREGQVFILINNIEELDKYKERITKLVPEALISTGHGQMPAEKLNQIMEDFIDGKSDILICTTIIETGIDIPNVNTIIIINADRFGLAQLYQIRGRVGRSDKIAYAYLMYNPAKMLTETAIKRLDSIKEFTELGSGYKIAMRDLAIRGAGDLLGSEQAGFIDAVGLDLYTKMVDEEVKRLNGIEVEDESNISNPSLNISTHIKDDYVEDESIKIEIHKLINSIKNLEDLTRVKTELIDRFGKLEENMEIYMLTKCAESFFEELKITNIIQTQKSTTIVIPQEISDKIDGEKLFLEALSINPRFEFGYKNKEIRISLNTTNLKKNYIYYIFELLITIKRSLKMDV